MAGVNVLIVGIARLEGRCTKDENMIRRRDLSGRSLKSISYPERTRLGLEGLHNGVPDPQPWQQ